MSNIVLDVRYGRQAQLREIAFDLVGQNVNVLVAVGTPATRAAKSATSTIPIVMVGVADPVESGFAASLARPGANLTGFSFVARDLVAKGLELLKEAVPTAVTVNVLWNPANPGAGLVLAHAESVAQPLRVRLFSMKVEHEGDLDAALSAMKTKRPDALVVINDSLFFFKRRQIIGFASTTHVPTMFQLREYVHGCQRR